MSLDFRIFFERKSSKLTSVSSLCLSLIWYNKDAEYLPGMSSILFSCEMSLGCGERTGRREENKIRVRDGF